MSSFDLKNYKILNKIGFGSFGEVFKIKDKRTDQILAAKVSKSFGLADEDFKKNFEREVSIIAKIHHPSILQFVGVSMTDFDKNPNPVIVTGFLPNGSLNDILDNSHRGIAPEQWNETLKLINIYGIASAMAFLHEHGIIHRDLKPDNILLDQFLFPVIADFGFSKEQSIEQSTIGIKGTPMYIAPEIWEDSDYSEKSDVYAFAYILYEIYANQKPFKNLTWTKLSYKVCNGERPDTSFIPNPYKQLIEKCWSQEPKERPTSAEIVERLENDKDFINDLIEEDDFLKYVNYIKESPKSVDGEETEEFDFDISSSKIIKKVNLKKKRILPDEQYSKLSKSCKEMVDKAIDDPALQYEVGLNLTKGANGFEKDITTAIEYLQNSIKGGNIDAVILYNRMLIIGKKIAPDLEQAQKNLKNYEDLNNPEIIFLNAMIEKKNEKIGKAVRLLKRAIKGKCGEAMFEYGKMLYIGEDVEEDKKKAMELFERAKKNGCSKSDIFLREKVSKKIQAKRRAKVKYDKYVDLVLLLDGTISNTIFYESLKQTFGQIAIEIKEDNPTTCFRFGVILYRDYAFSRTRGKRLYNFILDLTEKVDDVQNFFNNYRLSKGLFKQPNDWETAYFTLLERIKWNKNAEKVVVHMCHLPGHGAKYTIKSNWRSKYFKFLRVGRGDRASFRNFQKKQGERLTEKIGEMADRGFKFYCLNGNEVSCYCFRKVRDKFKANGGKKFVIKDLFGYTYEENDDIDLFDFDTLNETIDSFFSNVVKSCLIDSREAGEDDDVAAFERKCNQQFNSDFNRFCKKNGADNYRSTETTETDEDDAAIDDDSDDGLGDIFDNDDIDDNDDGEDVFNRNVIKKKKFNHIASTPEIPKYAKPQESSKPKPDSGKRKNTGFPLPRIIDDDDDNDGDGRPAVRKSPSRKRGKKF